MRHLPTQEIDNFLREILEIHRDRRLLERCFTEISAKHLGKESIGAYAFNIPEASFLEKNELLRDLIIENSDIFSKIKNPKPIFFYAYVGQGKTTYLHYLFDILLQNNNNFKIFKKQTYSVFVSYRKEDTQCKSIKTDILSRLEIVVKEIFKDNEFEESYELYSQIFEADSINYERRYKNRRYQSFIDYLLEKYSDEQFLRNRLRWLLEEKGIKVCCIVDNIDQHFYFEGNVSRFIQLFQDIQHLYLQLILPMRFANKGIQEHPFFNAYNPLTVTLGLPDFAKLIEKRIKHVSEHFEFNLKEPIIAFEDDSLITNEEIFSFYKSICTHIDKNSDVKHSLEMLSNYSPRTYLNIMYDMFNSSRLYYHPLTDKKIDYQERVKNRKFKTLFLYALMLMNNDFHNEDDARIPIINLFDNKSLNNWNSFIRFHILSYLDKIGKPVNISSFIVSFTEKYKILSEDIIKNVLKFFIEKKCIRYMSNEHMELEDIAININKSNGTIDISPRGIYHLELSKELEYYEILALQRLFIRKKDSRTIEQTSKLERAENLKVFIKDLKKKENHLEAIYFDNRKYKEHLIWTNEIYNKLIEEFNFTFSDVIPYMKKDKKTANNKWYRWRGKD